MRVLRVPAGRREVDRHASEIATVPSLTMMLKTARGSMRALPVRRRVVGHLPPSTQTPGAWPRTDPRARFKVITWNPPRSPPLSLGTHRSASAQARTLRPDLALHAGPRSGRRNDHYRSHRRIQA